METKPIRTMHRSLLPALAAGALLIAGCGGGDEPAKPKKLTGKPDPTADRVGQQYVDAYVQKKPKVICGLLASAVITSMKGQAGCLKAVKESLRLDFQKLTVSRSFVNGEKAVVTFKQSPRQVTLAKEGGAWKVVNGGT